MGTTVGVVIVTIAAPLIPRRACSATNPTAHQEAFDGMHLWNVPGCEDEKWRPTWPKVRRRRRPWAAIVQNKFENDALTLGEQICTAATKSIKSQDHFKIEGARSSKVMTREDHQDRHQRNERHKDSRRRRKRPARR